MFFLFNLILWTPRALKHGDIISLYHLSLHVTKYMYLCKRKIFAKYFNGWGTDRNIIKISCHSRLFFVLHLLVNSEIVMVIARKVVDCVFTLIQFFSYLRKQGWLFSLGTLRRIHQWVRLNGLFDFCTPWNWQKIIDFLMVLGKAELNWFAWTRLILYTKCGNVFSNFIVCLFILSLFIS